MTELCLPWTWGCPLLRSFQQSLGVKLWHCGQKASGESLREKNLMDKKGLIFWSLSLTELCSDLASFSHSDASLCVPKPELILNGVRIPSAAGSPSGSGATVPSISGGRWNIAQLHPWLHFPTPSYPMMLSHWQAISATLSYLSGFLVAVRVERLSPVLFFFFFPSGQAQLHFLWCYQTLCFQNRYSTTWGVKLNSSLPTSSQLKVMRKTIGPGEDVGLPVLRSLP